MEGAVDTLAVPSDEHTPLSEIVVNLILISVQDINEFIAKKSRFYKQ
jgi:hypothetical protein